MTDTTTADRWTAHRIELSNGIFECDCGDVSFPSTAAALDHLNAAAALAPELVEALRGLVTLADSDYRGCPECGAAETHEWHRSCRVSAARALLARLDQEANGGD